MKINISKKTLSASKRATAGTRAVATATQAVNALGAFKHAIANGFPEQKHPQSGNIINPGATAEEFKEAATDDLGEEIVQKLLKAAALFHEDAAAVPASAKVPPSPGRKRTASPNV